MSDDLIFRCPVCRARQPLQETCRRCAADLRLVVRAQLRLAYIKEQLAQLRTSDDHERRQQLTREQRWLSPGCENLPTGTSHRVHKHE